MVDWNAESRFRIASQRDDLALLMVKLAVTLKNNGVRLMRPRVL